MTRTIFSASHFLLISSAFPLPMNVAAEYSLIGQNSLRLVTRPYVTASDSSSAIRSSTPSLLPPDGYVVIRIADFNLSSSKRSPSCDFLSECKAHLQSVIGKFKSGRQLAIFLLMIDFVRKMSQVYLACTRLFCKGNSLIERKMHVRSLFMNSPENERIDLL